jgi:hypothetical protein
MTRNDFGLLTPRRTRDAVHFFIPSLGDGAGGRVQTFKRRSDLRDVKSYYDSLGKKGDPLFSWTFVNRRRLILVQINGELPQAKAVKYKRVLKQIR